VGSRAPAHEGAPYLISFIGGGEEALKIGTAMMSAVIGQASSVPLGVANFPVADDSPGIRGTTRKRGTPFSALAKLTARIALLSLGV